MLSKTSFKINIFVTRKEMGIAAAEEFKKKYDEVLCTKNDVNVVFAAAPSQNDFYQALLERDDIDFSKINAFHMDEYIGLDKDAPQGFGNFLKDRLFGKVNFKSVNYLDISAPDPEAECNRYSELLKKNPTDIVCLGIGENGHIAFNDPHVAFFNDEKTVKIVELDLMCRTQQVNDGCFEKLSDVPTHALTLTIPSLTNAAHHICIVPAPTKANAVKNTVYGPITEECPASVLRLCKDVNVFLDADSSALC